MQEYLLFFLCNGSGHVLSVLIDVNCLNFVGDVFDNVSTEVNNIGYVFGYDITHHIFVRLQLTLYPLIYVVTWHDYCGQNKIANVIPMKVHIHC